jgi:uncharacterized protein (DUF58 family)
MMITTRGVGLTVVAVLLFFLATYTRVGWLFMFDAVLIGTLGVSALMPLLAVGRLHVLRRVVSWPGRDEVPGPNEGEPVEFEVTVENKGWLPAAFLTVKSPWGRFAEVVGKERVFIAWLGRRKSLTYRSSIVFTRRGVHVLPGIRFECKAPFGLFRRSHTWREDSEIVVLPKVYRFKGIEMLASLGDASTTPTTVRVGDQLVGSRGYVFGDPWKQIHWRNSARTGQTQIKEYEQDPDDSMIVALDVACSQPEYDEAVEHAVKVAASVCDYICKQGGSVRLLANQISIESNDSFTLLRELALLDGGSNQSVLANALGSLPPFSDVLAIIRDTDDRGLEAARYLASSRHRMRVVVMRGFDEERIPTNPASFLEQAGAVVVECWRDEVEAVLQSLHRMDTQHDGGVRTGGRMPRGG